MFVVGQPGGDRVVVQNLDEVQSALKFRVVVKISQICRLSSLISPASNQVA